MGSCPLKTVDSKSRRKVFVFSEVSFCLWDFNLPALIVQAISQHLRLNNSVKYDNYPCIQLGIRVHVYQSPKHTRCVCVLLMFKCLRVISAKE